MLVLSPGDLWEATEAARYLVSHRGPAYLRLDKSYAPATAQRDEAFRPGSIRTVREGSDVTLAATGGILGEALQAADILASQGIFCRVLSVHTIKPLDTDTLAAAASETGGIVSIEEHAVDGGLGGAIAEALMEAGAFPPFFVRMGLRNTFSSVVGSQQYLRKVYSLDAAAIARVVCTRLARGADRFLTVAAGQRNGAGRLFESCEEMRPQAGVGRLKPAPPYDSQTSLRHPGFRAGPAPVLAPPAGGHAGDLAAGLPLAVLHCAPHGARRRHVPDGEVPLDGGECR
jgi:hypothetical protein